MQNAKRIDDGDIAEIAKRAEVDARSVVRRLAGLPVRGYTGDRIDRTLAEMGIVGRVNVIGGE